jgi:UPF0755 protein
MKKLILISAISVSFLTFLALHYFHTGNVIKFTVGEGETASQIAKNLKKRNIISNPLWFRLLTKITFTEKKLKKGRYILRTHMSAEEALHKLLTLDGNIYVRITFLEGWRMEQIAQRLQENNITSAKEFLKIARSKNLEGYLFPSTYMLEEKTPAATVISIMTEEFDKTIKPLFENPHPMNLTEREVLTIASIIEREAVNDAERPLIAGVYLNRIKKGMPLEADPTVQYALGYNHRQKQWWKKGITYKDLKHNSPYNTYKHKSIPPGPICNMRYLSVHAVYNPAKFEALFFVFDNNGKHIFNVDFKEHVRAKHRIKRQVNG